MTNNINKRSVDNGKSVLFLMIIILIVIDKVGITNNQFSLII